MRQDVIHECDLPRLAMSEARHIGDFRKLRSVTIENGKIFGKWAANTKDGSGYWNPLAAYYKNKMPPPYIALARCKTSDAGIARFHESYGPIGKDLSNDPRSGSFDLDEFKLLTWRFRLAVALPGSLDRPAALRKALFDGLNEGVRKRWHDDAQKKRAAQPGEQITGANWGWAKAVIDLRDAAGLSPYPRDASEEDACERVREGFESLDDKELVAAVRRYLLFEFHDKLKEIRLRLDFSDGEAPRLIAECQDLLASLYWMLANDWDEGRAPRVCANCKKFFPPKRRGATYCDRPACNERGRRKLDWDRNKAKYNRNRNRKRANERRARTKSKVQLRKEGR